MRGVFVAKHEEQWTVGHDMKAATPPTRHPMHRASHAMQEQPLLTDPFVDGISTVGSPILPHLDDGAAATAAGTVCVLRRPRRSALDGQ